jgi:hypothetical protein
VGTTGTLGKANGVGGGGKEGGTGEETLRADVAAISTGILSSDRIFFRSKSFPLGSSTST